MDIEAPGQHKPQPILCTFLYFVVIVITTANINIFKCLDPDWSWSPSNPIYHCHIASTVKTFQSAKPASNFLQ